MQLGAVGMVLDDTAFPAFVALMIEPSLAVGAAVELGLAVIEDCGGR